ncbi:VWA domain-containing protein [Afifella sp. H1R]|uniref:VWA domain-containing protein n=1 Tax=unclassified Afifella TaxID=2624128 RepID=UPI001F351E25|nr:VWA domain-containing protein [Afifella sp. H1R]MCF1502751.1 VWA domain-containing protein [Afifella sp. H1R]
MTKGKDITTPGRDLPSEKSRSSRGEIDAFLKQANSLAPVSGDARGRLVFALDATMSRQPTWDLACGLQAEMFKAAADVGGLTVQLVFFRGFGECRASRWVADPAALRDLMVGIGCRGGKTQIKKVLAHTRRETEKRPIAALVYVGDAMEEEVDELSNIAGELGLLGVRAFMFHEGRDPRAEAAFREIARLTRGAYLPFNSASASELKDLLGAVATYAAGGLKALEASGSSAARRLLPSLK